METNKTKTKNKSRLRNKVQKRSEDEESNAEVELRVVLTPVKGHSRSSSTSLVETVDTMRPGTSGKNKLNRQESLETEKGDAPSEFAEERKELEKFLFEEANKVTKTAIKYILEKWAAMETRLQSALVENKILKEKCKCVESRSETLSYAQAAAMRKHEPRPQSAIDPRKKASPAKEKYEVVIMKPEKEDRRNNDLIKEEVLKELERVRTKLKVRNIRQLRKQGVLLQVMDKTDVETINACGLNKEGFVVQRPKKVNPSII